VWLLLALAFDFVSRDGMKKGRGLAQESGEKRAAGISAYVTVT
jgi:hypothetical protein